jgi:hypothetical protein
MEVIMMMIDLYYFNGKREKNLFHFTTNFILVFVFEFRL